MTTFFVVSFPDLVISSSVISCGFFSSALFFSNFVRFAAFRFFCSIDRGPSLSAIHYSNIERIGRLEVNAHEVHNGHAMTLSKYLSANLLPVERNAVVFSIVIVR